MDYSFGTPAVVQGAMNRFKDSFINWQLRADLREHRDIVRAVAWRLDGRLLASADSAGQIKFWARGWDSGVQRLQKFSMGAGGWCCYQTLDVPVNILQRMPEEAAIFSRPPSDTAPSNLSSPTARYVPGKLLGNTYRLRASMRTAVTFAAAYVCRDVEGGSKSGACSSLTNDWR